MSEDSYDKFHAYKVEIEVDVHKNNLNMVGVYDHAKFLQDLIEYELSTLKNKNLIADYNVKVIDDE